MRIVVIRTSGAGKTTFARRIAGRLQLPHIELDASNWQAGWRDLTRHDPDAFVALGLEHVGTAASGNRRTSGRSILREAGGAAVAPPVGSKCRCCPSRSGSGMIFSVRAIHQGRRPVPTVLRTMGFRVYFWSREPNEPPHVHLDKGGASANVWLEPVTLASSVGYAALDLDDILRLVGQDQPELLAAWHEFFGTG